MGFYIETSVYKGKADWLVEHVPGTKILSGPDEARRAFDDGLGVICVVDNGPFEAAGYAFDKRELEEFARPDTSPPQRPRTWLSMDKDKAIEFSGYKAPKTG